MSELSADSQNQRTIASGTILKLELAGHYASGGWKPAVRSLVRRLHDGESLESLATSPAWKAPPQFRALLSESLRVADPAQLVLDVCLQRARTQREWRSLMRLLIYPAILLIAALVLSLVFGFIFTSSVDISDINVYGWRGNEYAFAMHEDQRNALIGMSFILLWTLVIFAAVFLVGPKWSVYAIMGGVPLLGGPCRWLGLSELLGRIELFTRQGQTLVEAIRAVEKTFHGSGLAVVAGAVGGRVGRGTLFGQALKQSMLSDGLCRPALGLLDQGGANSREQLRRVSELLQTMAAQRCRLLAFLLPTILFLAVGSIIGNAISSYFTFFTTVVAIINALR